MIPPTQIEPLIIKGTDETPEVNFNVTSGKFLLKGRSLPEDAFSFYKPILDWLDKFITECNRPFELKIHLDYFNSSSGRYLLEMLVTIEEKIKDQSLINIEWVSDSDDELMIEKGEEFKSLLSVPVKISLLPA